jgi:hypothetical protein
MLSQHVHPCGRKSSFSSVFSSELLHRHGTCIHVMKIEKMNTMSEKALSATPHHLAVGRWRWMEVDRGRWMEADGDGWRWMETDGGGWRWMEVDGDRWRWMEMDGGGWRWMEVDGGG